MDGMKKKRGDRVRETASKMIERSQTYYNQSITFNFQTLTIFDD
jgi:hypothetical protein